MSRLGMYRPWTKWTLGLCLLMAGSAIGGQQALAGGYRTSRGNDLFYNFYVGPAPFAGGVPAGLYPAPLPTPPLVGHTYITYQPLMPHEFLYQHHRHYYRHHRGGGWVTTRVVWW